MTDQESKLEGGGEDQDVSEGSNKLHILGQDEGRSVMRPNHHVPE
jgi:hypothetical protein